MSEILSNTGVKLWSETDYNELWLTIFDQLTGQGGKSNIRLIDEAIGKINAALDGYKFEFSSDEDRLYISKGDSKLPVSLIDSNGHVATKVDGTTITIDENGVIKGVPVDDALSEESTNPLQNKVITGELKSIKSKMGTDESAIKQNTSDITSNTKRIEANETAISTLNGTGDGSVKKAVSDGIAEVVAGAPEDFDTLKEMSDWISTHETSASAMNSQIQDNKKAIDNHALNGDVHVTPENKTNWNKVSEKLDKTGDASNVTTEFTTATTRSNLTTKEKLSISFGKISKWFSDLKDVAFSGSYNDLSDKPIVDANISSTSTNPVQNKVVTSNLTDLKYGEVAGGKNLFKNYDLYGVYRVVAETYNGNSVIYSSDNWSGACQSDLILKKGKTYAISAYVKGSGQYFIYCDRVDSSSSSVNIEAEKNLNSEWTKITKVFTPEFDVHKVRIETYNGNLYISCFQIEDGAQATDYEPYIPSVKMLAEEKAAETTVNLLNSTLETITQNGVTCTNNGDGTYTLNGTATSTVRFQFGIDDNLIVGKTYKALGIPIAGSYSTILMGWDNHGYFNKDGLIDKKKSEPRPISMQVLSGYTCNNLVFKPMITTNLSATYDDFVPYTGDTGRLNGDVAELKAEMASNKTIVDAAMSDTSTNPVQNKVIKKYVDEHEPNIKVDSALSNTSEHPVQNKVIYKALEGRANDIAFDESTNKLSLKSGETVLKEVEEIQKGYYVGSNPPTNKSILWIDSSHGGIMKYYANAVTDWHPVRAKGSDSQVDLFGEGYWNFALGDGITIEGLSAIYDINTGKITVSADSITIPSDAVMGPSNMVTLFMPYYNIGSTGTIAATAASGPVNLEMRLAYPNGYIQVKGGSPYAIYKGSVYKSIKFEVSNPSNKT